MRESDWSSDVCSSDLFPSHDRGKQPLQIRTGINTGKVVAGVIGTHKFIYDLWGDTVNVASRMESSGEPGHIQAPEAMYEVLKDHYNFEERGEVEVKGKGFMKTYWLRGRRSESPLSPYPQYL